MKIESKIFFDFVKKTSLNGKIMTLELDFTETQLNIRVKDDSNIAMVLGYLEKEAFETYEAIGKIFIKNSRFYLDILSTFEDMISITKKDEHLLVVADEKRDANIILAEKSICENIYEGNDPEIETTVEATISRQDLLRIVRDMKLIKTNIARITAKENNLQFQIGKENEYDFINNHISIDGSKEEVSVGIADYIIDIADVITSSVVLRIGTNLPLVFIEKGDFFSVTTYIAPIVEDEDA